MLILTGSFSQVKFKIFFTWQHLVILTDGSIGRFDSVYLGVVAPSQDGFVSRDRVLVEEEVCRNSSVGIEAEIISIFKVVADKLFFTCVYDWIDVVEVESKLTVTIYIVVDIGTVVAGRAREQWVVSCTLSYLYLSKFKYLWGVLTLHLKVVADWRAQPLLEIDCSITFCYTICHPLPMLFSAGHQRNRVLDFSSSCRS